MIIKICLASILFLTTILSNCQNADEYQVYALKYIDGRNIPAQRMVIGANPKDSLRICYMYWFLKGENGKNILVDAGFVDSTKTGNMHYVRPDVVLKRLNVDPSDITDIIITHPHYDHIGGINLFPNAKIWMQKDDFEYFVGEAWQENGISKGFEKKDVRNIIEINLEGRLKMVEGDNIEIIPGIKIFIGSKHTFENQYVLVNSNSKTNKILIASDALWFYYNLDNLLSASLCMDPKAYIVSMKRMKTLVTNPDFIIPAHDDLVFSKFPKIGEWIVKIGN
ncbi:MAG: N-acyl homoserine lactonase family protein [Bacteroidia bacterium]|nr:N-acyl homoserine lactonase family protein [Bacteroidia bacterium]